MLTAQRSQMKKAQLMNRVNRDVLLHALRTTSQARTTLSFYKYHYIENPEILRNELYLKLDALQTKGRVYIAHEGINAQISIPNNLLETLTETLYSYTYLNNVRLNVAIDDGKSFFKLTIKVKDKIVADGLNDATFDASDTGTHLDAPEFNKLTDDSNTILVDMRNHYESEVGYFDGAIRPDAETFQEEIKLVEDIIRGKEDKNIVMYCTGGIRCEKASAWFKHKGFKNMFQLKGGIITYAQQVRTTNERNKFKGINFVFDERLGERISDDIVSQCHQCQKSADTHRNCVNDGCNLLFIQCDTCFEKTQGCCSQRCFDFIQLPKEEQKLLRKTMQPAGKSNKKRRVLNDE